jgi:hypothetical protein
MTKFKDVTSRIVYHRGPAKLTNAAPAAEVTAQTAGAKKITPSDAKTAVQVKSEKVVVAQKPKEKVTFQV